LTQTLEKDFKVKNGLQVAGSGTFGGPVTAATPTNPNHLTTKQYVDNLSFGGGGVVVGPTEPESPQNGLQWFDTSTLRLKIYYDTSWFSVANIEDTLNVVQHTHDAGTGLVNYIFLSAGEPQDESSMILDGGTPSTIIWSYYVDSGSPEVIVNNLDGGNP